MRNAVKSSNGSARVFLALLSLVFVAGGAAVGGASVVVTNLDTGQSLSAASDAEGRYRFAYLRWGADDPFAIQSRAPESSASPFPLLLAVVRS